MATVPAPVDQVDSVPDQSTRARTLNVKAGSIRARTLMLEPDVGHTDGHRVSQVHCPEGHVMKARIVRELLNVVLGRHYQTRCSRCDEVISTKDACYHCGSCSFSLCVSCSSSQHKGVPDSPSESTESSSICSNEKPATGYILAGDILFCGPDKWGIHHVILCRSATRPASSDVVRILDRGSNVEIFECLTIESSRPLKGEDIAWYASRSFFELDKQTRKATLIADMGEGSRCINVVEEPIPVKLLTHPLRPGHGGPAFDVENFHDAVKLAADTSRTWGHFTAIKSVVASLPRSRLNATSYSDPAARASLMKDIRRRWERKPICATVAIHVWQLYFTLASAANAESDDVAVERILQWMPLHADKTVPSTLMQVLSTSGWKLHDYIEF